MFNKREVHRVSSLIDDVMPRGKRRRRRYQRGGILPIFNRIFLEGVKRQFPGKVTKKDERFIMNLGIPKGQRKRNLLRAGYGPLVGVSGFGVNVANFRRR